MVRIRLRCTCESQNVVLGETYFDPDKLTLLIRGICADCEELLTLSIDLAELVRKHACKGQLPN
jgi:hypothetical protein